ncbi:MAG: Nramp family divalent metal transporter [Burkholderiales bacterium]|uniref:Nramp family divalent metal transporter n=1 Tax=Nitrosomonas sp. TaxID=42353 RepID=UPI001D387938|nr:Nramp family divalent metal transporter [Nitrosomonas sp.]MCB1947701.1 Nramp family divalent metal transporter [Nitrosomonas sp.]MCP5244051.1 Nramp family divalent metal transporter [Burkholderiales bacterium]
MTIYKNLINGFLTKLGPGLLYAGAAVGVSHLVQSTRAGSMFGFDLLIAILIIHLIKYPFFEFGPRYTAATGKNILHGYQKLGDWAIWVYLLMTIATMFIVQAAVTVVTAGLFTHIFGLEELGGHTPQMVAAIISSLVLILCFTLLASGRYVLLDRLIKIIILVLSITSITAVVALLFDNPGHYSNGVTHFDMTDAAHLLFLAAFLGWMPAPVEISVWHSVWSESKNETEGKVTSMKEALFDFRVGFIGTAFLAMCFLTLGALVMYGSGVEFAPGGAAFAEQLLDMYKQALGDWAYPIVAIAALTTMFSTTLTLLDAFPRTISMSLELISPHRFQHRINKSIYIIWLLITIAGTLSLLFFFMPSMSDMVKVATVIAFVAAPILATLNTLAMFDKSIPEPYRPGKLMLAWCISGLTALISCSVGYLWLM